MRPLFAAALPFALLLLTPTAHAEDRHPSIATVGGGYGLQDDSDAGSYGPAIALRVAARPVGVLHLGGQGTFHIGSRFGSEQNRVQLYGVEAGARLGSDRIAAIPYLAGGIALIEKQRHRDPLIFVPYLAAGLGMELVVADPWLLQLDLRGSLALGGDVSGDSSGPSGTIDILALGGVRF